MTKHALVVKPNAWASRLVTRLEAGIPAYAGGYDNRTDELLTMLRTMRPAGSQTERDFVEQWIEPLGTEADGYGNQWLTIGDSPILWSCHTDTVHTKAGTQYVGFKDGCAYVTRSNCLGADDTTGVWIMRHMIKAGIPGTYVFHRAEEVGGLGSNWVLKNNPECLTGFKFAIAFDRMGYEDIITYQGGNTASEAFAESLSAALAPLPYAAADGIFTDTAVYADAISECSNISVGYHLQHTNLEWQDVDYAMMLLDRLTTADFSGLQAVRDHLALYDPYEFDRLTWSRLVPTRDSIYRFDNLGRDHCPTMDDICRQYPEIVSDYLTSMGITVDDIKDYGNID